MNIGRRLAIVRQVQGLTIKEVSKLAKKSTYDRIETGKIDPKFGELQDICKVLNIEIWELTSEELTIRYNEKYNEL